MGVLDNLIAPKRGGRRPRAVARRSPVAALLLPQIEALGHAAGRVPGDGPTGSAWSRAYVLGAACAALQRQDAAPVSDQACFAAALDAFALAYGDDPARAMLAATVAAAEAHEPEVEDGLMQGASDLALAATDDAPAMHFALRNGEELGQVI